METAHELIEVAEARIVAAQEHLDELDGQNRHGLTVTRLHGFVVVDDEADRWIAEEDDYDTALAEVVERVLDGKEMDEADAYDCLCSATGCIYSRIGMGTLADLAAAIAELGEDEQDEILEAMAIDREEITEQSHTG